MERFAGTLNMFVKFGSYMVLVLTLCLGGHRTAMASGQAGPVRADWSELNNYVNRGEVRLYSPDGSWFAGKLTQVEAKSLHIMVTKVSRKGVATKGESNSIHCSNVSIIQWHETHGPMRKLLTVTGAIVGAAAGAYLAARLGSEDLKDFGYAMAGGALGLGFPAYKAGRRLDRETKYLRIENRDCQ